MKHLIELSPPINYLSHFNLYFSNASNLTMQGNKVVHIGSRSHETCVFKEILEPVCISSTYKIESISYSSLLLLFDFREYTTCL